VRRDGVLASVPTPAEAPNNAVRRVNECWDMGFTPQRDRIAIRDGHSATSRPERGQKHLCVWRALGYLKLGLLNPRTRAAQNFEAP